jgi:hypothetical protein
VCACVCSFDLSATVEHRGVHRSSHDHNDNNDHHIHHHCQCSISLLTTPTIAITSRYVRDLETAGLASMATTYGYDESDELDEMQDTFRSLKVACVNCRILYASCKPVLMPTLVQHTACLRAATASLLVDVTMLCVWTGGGYACQLITHLIGVRASRVLRYPSIKTFTTAHMCGKPGDWRTPAVPCAGGGVPVQDPAQIRRRNIDFMTPILDWIRPDNFTACVASGLPMWFYTSLEPYGTFCNLRVDNLLHEGRLLFWQAAQIGATGFLCVPPPPPPPTTTTNTINTTTTTQHTHTHTH